MNEYGILNSRKRAIVALIHTAVFGLLALYQFVIRQHPVAFLEAKAGHMAAPIALTAIYLIVTIVLLVLLHYALCAMERLYFGFCATSAGIGLIRAFAGDPTLYTELAVRVLLLGSAIVTATLILSSTQRPNHNSPTSSKDDHTIVKPPRAMGGSL